MLGDQWTEFIIFNQNATFVHQVCKLLLNKNAFVNSKTKLGWTALHFAANKVSNYFFLILFKNIKSTFNFPQGYTDLVEFLIKSGGTIGLKRTTTYLSSNLPSVRRNYLRFSLSDGMTIKKQTPMHLAGLAGQKATCVKLLELNVISFFPKE